jgi:hypothetical protein
MRSYLECKRAECLEEVEQCEKDLAAAKIKLDFINEVIADAEEYAAEENGENQ